MIHNRRGTLSWARQWRALSAVLAGLVLPAPGPPALDAQEPGSDRPAAEARETVVLLHGLGRTPRSMRPMGEALAARGYRVVNLGYPSREASFLALVDTLDVALRACCAGDAGPIHFVTHSMGGILLRAYLDRHPLDRLGRVVMLSPPNRGTEVVDRLGTLPLFEIVMGPAATELGTDPASLPRSLGPVPFELGVIAGDAGVNPFFSWLIPGPDDGAVGVGAAWVEGTDAFIVVPYAHTFIMRQDEVIRHVATFLETGRFGDGARSRP